MNKSLKEQNSQTSSGNFNYFGWRTGLEGRDESGEVGKADHGQL